MYPLVSTDYQQLNVLCKYSSVTESLLHCNSRAGQLQAGKVPAHYFSMLARREREREATAAVLMLWPGLYGK